MEQLNRPVGAPIWRKSAWILPVSGLINSRIFSPNRKGICQRRDTRSFATSGYSIAKAALPAAGRYGTERQMFSASVTAAGIQVSPYAEHDAWARQTRASAAVERTFACLFLLFQAARARVFRPDKIVQCIGQSEYQSTPISRIFQIICFVFSMIFSRKSTIIAVP